MRNIKVDNTNRIVWSAVEYADVVKAGVDDKDLDIKGRIAFNLSEDYQLYIAAYEFEQEKLKLVIQSNDPERYSAIKIAGVFEGKGNEYCASCVIKNAAASDFETVVYAVLKDLYGVVLDQPDDKKVDEPKVEAPEAEVVEVTPEPVLTSADEDETDNNPY